MKIGIIGLPQSGKKTLFNVLTDTVLKLDEIPSNKSIKGVARIKDSRFDELVKIYKPKSAVRARIDIEVLPKIEKDSVAKGDVFKDIAELDAICHIVRTFEDGSIYHVNGSVDPLRDIDGVNSELILNDLLFIEKRIERIDNSLKKIKDENVLKEKELLLKMKSHLDEEKPLRLFKIDKEEEKLILSYPLITRKKMIVVLNASEDKLSETGLLGEMTRKYEDIGFMQVSAKVESEIAGLETEQDMRDFLDALGIKEPSINVLSGMCIEALNLISFFTVGKDEVRQWNVLRGSYAPQAAGKIHTDLEKGFIRAEVIKYDDLHALGSEEKVKEAGKFHLKGKDYIVEDGDILCIRFNV